MCKEKYGVKYTVAGMDSWLFKNGFSYKRPQLVLAKADPLKQKEFVKEYKTLKEKTPNDEPIVFLDAVHSYPFSPLVQKSIFKYFSIKFKRIKGVIFQIITV